MNSVEEVRADIETVICQAYTLNALDEGTITRVEYDYDQAAFRVARFARSVLEPPKEVVEAMERIRTCRTFGVYALDEYEAIAKWALSLTAPAGEPHA